MARTSRRVAKIASKKLRNSSSKSVRTLAGCTLRLKRKK